MVFLKNLLWHLTTLVIFVYVVVPLVYLSFAHYILPEIIFLHRLSWSHYFYPDVCDVGGAFEDGKNIDVLVRGAGLEEYLVPAWWIPSDRRHASIVVYSHGNGFDRCKPRRIEVYRNLKSLGVSVLAYDYGGFSNSTRLSQPTSKSLQEDLRTVVDYANTKLRTSDSQKILLWGHSLGTGVSVAALKNTDVSNIVDALVLEAPFGDLGNLIATEHAYAEPFRKMYGKWVVEKATDYADMLMGTFTDLNTANNALEVLPLLSLPTLILHAVDDTEIPIHHADKLYNSLRTMLPQIEYKRIPEAKQLGHSFIASHGMPIWKDAFLKLLDD